MTTCIDCERLGLTTEALGSGKSYDSHSVKYCIVHDFIGSRKTGICKHTTFAEHVAYEKRKGYKIDLNEKLIREEIFNAL